MLKLVSSSQFKKDLKLVKSRNYNLDLLKEVVTTLQNQLPLDEKHQDHPLSGNFKGFRECHILPDWLLIYKASKKQLELYLMRTGTHSDLFRN